jgi:hypothetical protein
VIPKSLYTKGDKSMLFGAFFNEIDATHEQLFTLSKGLELLCFPDVLEEFKTFYFYEHINLASV